MVNEIVAGKRNERRVFLETALAGLLLSRFPFAAAAKPDAKLGDTPQRLLDRDLPGVSLDGWHVVASRLVFRAGAKSHPHIHPGFVIGYVIDGDFRFQVAGQPEAVLHVGEMFFEPLGAHHVVGESANPAKDAIVLALVFGKKGDPLTVPITSESP
ncbi:MAG TPA: cupin domain-containing protein [Candidatus Acidoferrales bacterium]|nr:cupin domain-containing protein [Candidatus Acidoferrales bacterium]